LAERFIFSFDSWQKESAPGDWDMDFTCTKVDSAESDFTNLLFAGASLYLSHEGGPTSSLSENACGMDLGLFRAPGNLGKMVSGIASE
jgi:hypothetical protein